MSISVSGKSLMRGAMQDSKDNVRAASSMNCVVYLANDAVGMSLNETLHRLKMLPLYKGEVKFRLRNVEKQFRMYEATLADTFTPAQRQLHMDMLDESYEVVRRHVAMIRQTAMNFFTKEQLGDRETMAYVVETEVMLSYAAEVWKAVTNVQRQMMWNYKFKGDQTFNITGVRKAWDKVIRLLIPADLFCRLCDDRDFQLAQECFGKNALDFDKINEACLKAIELNRDMVDEYIASHPEEF